jgi:hypothetical protein
MHPQKAWCDTTDPFPLPAGSAAQGVKYTSSTGNINGQLLVLDVTSLSFQVWAVAGDSLRVGSREALAGATLTHMLVCFSQGNHPMFPAYGRPTDCEKACKNMPECSAWTFCNSTSGCGSGCIDYVNKNPPCELPAAVCCTGMLPVTGSWQYSC